ncbi:MAG: esterase/lipase family protein [Porticoccaceae bacterium]
MEPSTPYTKTDVIYEKNDAMEELLEQLEDEEGPFAHDPSIEPTYTPLWREAKWPAELLQLYCSPVFWGRGVKHGKGQPVIVIPGFLANDIIMLPMRQWLNRIGYKSHAANILWNTDCPNKTADTLARQVAVIHRKTGRKVMLIGHSLGGMLAKSVVQKIPELIDRVVTVGSPFRDIVKAHPSVVGVWDYLKVGQGRLVGRNLHASCGTGYCMCDFVRHMIQPQPLTVPQFAIFSRNDGVVAWQSCAEEDPAMNTEANKATHIGLAFQIDSYRALAMRLAQSV